MSERIYLEKSIKLLGGNDSSPREFKILNSLGSGGSVLCYTAKYGNSATGVLKEFYPKNDKLLTVLRDEESMQVIPLPGSTVAERSFQRAMQDFLEPYETLIKLRENEEDSDLRTFIPDFELFRGCDDEGNPCGTAYVWTPAQKATTFKEKCREIHEDPYKNPEYDLLLILKSIATLTECVGNLHCAELLHLDINPDNFGFYTRNGELLTQNISMFDISAMRSVYKVSKGQFSATEGYAESELWYSPADNQTDIYAIGATLYHALMITDTAKEDRYLYKDSYFEKLPEMLRESKLIQASEANSHPKLLHKLSAILMSCLAPREDRYLSCELLKKELDEAIKLAVPSEFSQLISSDKDFWKTISRALDKNKKKNSTRIMQYHLAEYPLYNWCNEGKLNVMVIGFGAYGRAFLDLCLQLGLMPDEKPGFTVISDTEQDQKEYLSERPSLADFFRINGSSQNMSQDISYGDIIFETEEFSETSAAINRKILKDILKRHKDNVPQYIFVATGNDELNRNIAEALRSVSDQDLPIHISYAVEKKLRGEKEPGVAVPVYVNTDTKNHPLYDEIERMAFNTHIIWEENLNLDYKYIRNQYNSKYCHDSSVALAISVQYKLYSINKLCGLGLELEKGFFKNQDFMNIARVYEKSGFRDSPAYREQKNKLVYCEHARWVVEKICQGWKNTADYGDFLDGSTNNKRQKIHLCILPSRPDQMLKDNYTHSDWDSMSEEKISALDRLDQLSVRLHQAYKAKAEELIRQPLLSGGIIDQLREMIQGNKSVCFAFSEWLSCLTDIHRERKKTALYKSLKNAFLSAVKDSFSKDKAEYIQKQVEAFDKKFYPLVGSMQYRNFKDSDTAIIDCIPFILTYSHSLEMIIPFALGDNTAIFGNISAATIANPCKISYLCYIERSSDIYGIGEALEYVCGYMDKKNIRSDIELLICGVERNRLNWNDGEIQDLEKISPRIKSVKWIPAEAKHLIGEELIKHFSLKKSNSAIFACEQNKTAFSFLLEGSGFFDRLAGEPFGFDIYSFDSRKMSFDCICGNGFLKYIKKSHYITVADMTAFKKSGSESSSRPEFFDDYMKLWDKYNSKNSAWKSLCDKLKKYSEKNDILAALPRDSRKKASEPKIHRYYMPFFCSSAIKKVIEGLIENKMLEDGSEIQGYSSDTCCVVLMDRYGFKDSYDQLFSNPYAFMRPDNICVKSNVLTHNVYVVFDDLIVKNLNIGNMKNKDDVLNILSFMNDNNYITNLKKTDDCCSFSYSTHNIKQLLTSEGRMLEIFTYHKVKELGKFDDIVSGHEVIWGDSSVKSEFDCIITKGFSTLIVECKACANIKQEYYYKLSCLAGQFGINTTAVLIADTREKDGYDTVSGNNIQRERGNMLNVITVSKKEDINNIGETLLDILNGKYST